MWSSGIQAAGSATSDWYDESRNVHDHVVIRSIHLALILSLLLHVAVLWWPWMPKKMHFPSLENLQRGESGGSLVVELPSPASEPTRSAAAPAREAALREQSLPAQLPRARRAPPAKAAARHPPAHPAMTFSPAVPGVGPLPDARQPPDTSSTPALVAPVPSRQPGAEDLATYVEARQRARAEAEGVPSGESAPSAPSVESESERHNRIVAENLGLRAAPTFGNDPRYGGGVFQIEHVGYDEAEFIFYGWNKDIRRNSSQRIETRKGENSDIRIAVIRKIITIIREQESGEFTWISRRLGREITLSAAPQDNAGLEDFLMREFFGEARPAQ